MKRIAIFQNDLNIGGIQKSLINLLNKLDYSQIAVDLFLFDENSCWENKVDANVNIYHLKPMNKIYKYLPFEFAFTKADYSFEYIDFEYDAVFDYNSYQPWTAICSLLVPASKRVIWVHNDIKLKYAEEWKYRILFKAMKEKYKYFEDVVCVSDAIAEPFKLMTGEYDKKYHVIPNVIDTEEIYSLMNEPIDDIEIKSDTLNICAVGRLCHQKGYDIMLDVFSAVKKRRDDVNLYIIGNGPDFKDLKKRIDSFDLEDNVFLLGNKNNPFSYMNKCDAFVSTSRYEGQGMNILEAKSLGLQIIIPKHLEKYVPGVNGVEDVVDTIVNLQVLPKNYCNLEEYNSKILANIYNLC